MSKLICIGEYLIDFTAESAGKLKDVSSFSIHPGGAPANVAVANQKLGGKSLLLTKLGADPFGDFLLDTLISQNVSTKGVKRTSDYNTSLAFVSITEDGERDFVFYRQNASDLHFLPSELEEEWFEMGNILHFCSVSLVKSPMREAHVQAIKYAQSNKMLVSFDPNIRLNLWENHHELKRTIWEFIPKAHILKISQDELFFITGSNVIDENLEKLFVGNVQLLIHSKGAEGAELIFKNGARYSASAYARNVIDTTGAGDALVAGILNQLLKLKITRENILSSSINWQEILIFASKVAAYVTEHYGAISALPTLQDVESYK